MVLYRDDVVCDAANASKVGLVIRGTLDNGDSDGDSDGEGSVGRLKVGACRRGSVPDLRHSAGPKKADIPLHTI